MSSSTITYPLSPAQERLVFIHEVSGADDAYLFPVNLRLRGELAVEHLAAALRDLVERHEVLRSRLVESQGTLAQAVAPEPVALEVTDLSQHTPDRAVELAEEAAASEAATPFDLREQWIRLRLLRLAETDHVLLVSVHHVAFDGWSCQIFLQELAGAYNARIAGRRPEFETLAASYGDIARWGRERLATDSDEAARQFWTAQTENLPQDLALGTDFPRPEVPSGRTGRLWWHLGADRTEEVEAAARRHKVTLYMLLLAAFEATLSGTSGQTDFFVGGATAGRSHPESGSVIGLFVNDVVYRCDVEADQTLEELVRAVKRRALTVYQYQDHPFERVVAIAGPPRQLDRHPLFQHAITLQPREGDDVEVTFDGLAVEGFTTHAEGSALELSFSFHYESDGLHLAVDFATDLWRESSAQTLVDNFRTVLDALCDPTSQRLDDLDLVPLRDSGPAPTATNGADRPEPVPAATPTDPQVDAIVRVFSDLLAGEVSADTDFFAAGGDSILAMRAVSRLRTAGLSVSVRDLFRRTTPRGLAALSGAAEPAQPGGRPATHVRPEGTMPALPMQAWFDAGRPRPEFYNFSALLRHDEALDVRLLTRAVAVVLKRHDATRMRFAETADGDLEVRHLDGAGHSRLETVDLNHLSVEDAEAEVHRQATEIQASLTILGDGPLIRVVLFQCPAGVSRLLVAASHLIMDVVSMEVVLDDVRDAYAALLARRPIELPELTASSQAWSEGLREWATSPEATTRAAQWAVVEECAPSDVPLDHAEAPNLVADELSVFHRLSVAETAAVDAFVARTPGVTHESLILTAVGVALGEWIGDRGILIDLEHHGRGTDLVDLDVTRTVGWLTSIFPFPLSTGAAASGRRGLMRVTRDLLTGRDETGEYAALAAAGHGAFTERSVAFSHAGASGADEGPWHFENLAAQDARHPQMRRRHHLEVDSLIAGGVLRISLTYSTAQFDRDSIEQFAQRALHAVLEVADARH